MGKAPKNLTLLVQGLGVVGLVLFGAFMWDYNEAAQEKQAQVKLCHEMIRVYQEMHDANAVYCPYVGSKKGKVFHAFTSGCAPSISIVYLRPLKSYEEALEAGYRPCLLCNPQP